MSSTPARKTGQQISGQAAEQAALEHIQRHKLRLVTRNFNVRGGELDLVMLDGATLVFVEVRLRNRSGLVSAVESVSLTKQRRLIHAAQCFLAAHPEHAARPCRFDVIGIQHSIGMSTQTLEWQKNAFEANSY
ncbi:MAG: YraN family protein [Gammaproteobacteria bacterium 28-57-27]|nr:MAG: YraN family protein [Gammaproteobacteria bacterium 28-57-27]